MYQELQLHFHITIIVSMSIEIVRKNQNDMICTSNPYYTTYSLYDENGEPRIERDYEG